MRTLMTIVLVLSAGAAFGQNNLFGLYSTLTMEDTAVSWRDEFVVTYSVSGLPAGEYFISVFGGKARVVGGVPWHGFIADGKKATTVKLTVVFDSSYIRDNWGDRASFLVAASRKENPTRFDLLAPASIIVKLVDPPRGEFIVIPTQPYQPRSKDIPKYYPEHDVQYTELTPPKIVSKPVISFPADPELRGKGATVWVKVLVDSKGWAREAAVFKSTDQRFDRHALKYAKQYKFKWSDPKGNIKKVWIALPIRFVP